MSICPICSSEYEQPKYRETKTCSAECGHELQRRNRPTADCDQCGKSFSFMASKPKRFCSKACYHEWTAGRKVGEDVKQTRPDLYANTCRVCSKEFGTRNKDAKICSVECRAIANIKYPEKPCEQCGELYKPSGGASKYCSVECKNISSRVLRDCPCGQQFYSGRGNARGWSKFCSDECRNTYGETKLGVLETYVCVGCGEDFQIMSHYTSAKKYCSNKCAKKEQKKGWSKRAAELDNGDVLIFRSGYELRFYASCLRFAVPVRNYDGPDIQTTVGAYRPDFIIQLDGEEYVVEVKGHMTEESYIKIICATSTIDHFLLVDLGQLEKLESSGF